MGMDAAPFMPAILARIAPRVSAEVVFEPEFRVVGHVRFANGRQSYFWHNKFNLNSVSAARVAQDKGYTAFFLQTFGFRVPRWQTFFRERFRRHLKSPRGIAAACRFADSVGWPVYVKPCRGSQGHGIEMVLNARELRASLRRRLEDDRTVLVQERCVGRDYRIVVLDGRVISAYERVPLTVTGDGRSTVKALLADKQRAFEAEGRDTVIDQSDRRIRASLRRQRLTLRTVLEKGRAVRLLDVANLSCGGTTVEIMAKVHPTVARLAAAVAKAMDLRFAGIDLMCADATRPLRAYSILEVNSAPGLDHYGSFGPEHEARIDELYMQLLLAVKNGPPRR